MRKDAMRRLIVAAIFFLLVAATASASPPQESKQQTAESSSTGRIEIRVKGDRLSLDVVEADLADVLRTIAEKTGIDLTLGGGITGRVSIQLPDVTVEAALKRLCQSSALVYEYLPQNKSYRIIQAAAFTETPGGTAGPAEGSAGAGDAPKQVLPGKLSGEADKEANVRLSQSSAGPKTAAPERPRFKPGELLVKFKPDVTDQQIEALHRTMGSRVLGNIRKLRLQRVKLREGLSEEAAMTLYAGADIVEHAEKHALRYPNRVPNDPQYSLQWGLGKIAAPAAWDITHGNPEVIIAVVDTGVDYFHPDLSGNIWTNTSESIGDANGDGFPGIKGVDDDGDGLTDEDSLGRQPGEAGYTNDLKDDDDENGYVDDIHGWDFAGSVAGNTENDFIPDPDPMDVDGHGTHVAGIIAARGNNGLGIAGINWQARIMVLKVEADNAAYFEDFAILGAIEYAISKGAKIINCSFGGNASSSEEENAFISLENAGILAVCAAGNDSLDIDVAGQETYPAAYNLDNILSVAAGDQDDNLASFSNFGLTSVDVMAPGVGIYSTLSVDANRYTVAAVRVVGDGEPLEFGALGMEYAGTTSADGVTAAIYFCGLGYPQDFPAAVTDNIALIERGTLFFSEKAANARDKGAAAVIVYNNVMDDFDVNGGTLGAPGDWPPVVSITRADGEALRALGNPIVTVTNRPLSEPERRQSAADGA